MRQSLKAALAVGLLVPALAFAPSAAAQSKDECFNAAEKAQSLRREKKLGATREQLLVCVRDGCPAAVQTDCVKWLAEVDNGMPSVVVRARDAAGKDVLDVKVSVDGQAFLERLDGTSKTIDPGEHKFRYDFPDGTRVEDVVLVAEGEKDRVLRVETRPVVALGGGGGSGGAGPIPWIFMGIGAASLLGFGIVETIAQVRYSDYKDTCGVPPPGATTGTCDPANVSALRGAFISGLVLLGVGVVGLGVGITWLLVSGKKEAPPAAATAFDFRPLPGGGFMSFAGRF
ncbi:hypothetical protein BH09MYX1_BH09MYX1_42050 [soil metagenome]